MDSESLVDVGAGTPLLERLAHKWGRLFVYLLHEEHQLQQKQPQQQNFLYEKDNRKAILRSATNRRCQVLTRLPEFSLRIKIFL